MREDRTESVQQPSDKVKYRIKGEFCANCSAKMERALSGTEGYGETTINYITKTVYLPPSKRQEAQDIMEKIEPGVKLVELLGGKKGSRSSEEEETEKDLSKQLLRIGIASVLFVVGLIFASRWHNTSYHFLEYLVFISAYIWVGYEVLTKAIRNIIRGAVFDENFLMALATIGAIVIHQLPEAVGVMLFYAVGEYIEDRAVDRSRHSIQALLDIRPDSANLIHQLQIIKVAPEDVQVGQQIVVRPGEKVPLDGVVVNGSSYLDTSALTGESVPRKAEKDDTVLAGMINTSGALTVRVVREYADSSVQKILDLVENASARKAKVEKFITTFARYYTPGVVIVALGIAILPPLMGMGSFSQWLYRALTILVISCPCALVISVPLGYFGGIGGASRHGILVKGANYLEALTQLKTVVFDKTGTLTQGVFEVIQVQPTEGFKEERLLEIAAKAEVHSNHPIAQSIRKKFNAEIDASLIEDYEEISGKGVLAKVGGLSVIAGRKSLLEERGIQLSPEQVEQGTQVYLAIDGSYAGFIVISDQVRVGARETVHYLNQAGIKTVMLTGDHPSVAQSMAMRLGIQEFHAELLPEDKVSWLEKLLKEQETPQGKVAFVGDGINDAPVLTRADIGIAMGGLGSDAAIEAADVVLMEDQPTKLINALEISQFTKMIIWQNIAFALLIKLGFILLGMFGLANMWEAVFADVGVALLAILNATRVRRYSSPGIRLGEKSVQAERNLGEVTAK
ncbi:heavy metal translocating P-type ATPase [Desulfitobacterium metallireducens]|uniref:Zinc-transporting ATPase n=1 Tax=Desulfitobacterium metallireducens DSM 15288 TaxID=871968 RepID=W0EB12_9FIRM|nr:heavy metal translocating P-type ATPase [Desulfitobacterium metallireducens]AHF06236.1 zinc-transporting ATPase [Desulfitobacterium metallireducens DSM 15288]